MTRKMAEASGNALAVTLSLILDMSEDGEGIFGQYGACGWSVVQLDHAGAPATAWFFGAIEAGLEVQGTILRTDMGAIQDGIERVMPACYDSHR